MDFDALMQEATSTFSSDTLRDVETTFIRCDESLAVDLINKGSVDVAFQYILRDGPTSMSDIIAGNPRLKYFRVYSGRFFCCCHRDSLFAQNRTLKLSQLNGMAIRIQAGNRSMEFFDLLQSLLAEHGSDVFPLYHQAQLNDNEALPPNLTSHLAPVLFWLPNSRMGLPPEEFMSVELEEDVVFEAYAVYDEGKLDEAQLGFLGCMEAIASMQLGDD